MKNFNLGRPLDADWLRQKNLAMKLTTFLLLVSLFQIQANTYAQNTKISLQLKDATVEQVFKEIESLSDFRFLYNHEKVDIQRKVSVNAEKKQISSILEAMFADTDIYFSVKNKQIILKNGKEKDSNTKENAEVVQHSFSGTITDMEGIPLPGANILEKGTTNGVTADFDGNFSITVTNSNSILVVSYIGYATTEIPINGKTSIKIALKESAAGLEEVVVVAYGTTTKKKLVSSISTIDTKDITEAPYSSVIQGLSGRTPGLFTRESGGEYGSLPTISIRGAGEPTYVIDGIISSKQEFAAIPPNDIDNISFLKDAAAAAVYGFNSANGIVLITTKKGELGKVSVTYSNNMSFQNPTLLPEYQTAYQKALLTNQAAYIDGLPQVIDNELLNVFQNNLDPIRYPNLNPFKEATKSTALQSRHSLTLNGTMNKTRVYMSLDYFNQGGIYKTNDFGLDRYSMRSNITHEFEDIGLTVNGNISLQRNLTTAPPVGTGTIWSHIRNYQPGTPYYNPNGNYTGLENPLAESDEAAGYTKNETNRVVSRLDLTWEVPGVEGLKLKGLGNFRYTHDLSKSWRANQRNSAPTYNFDNVMDNMGTPSLSQSTGRSDQYDLEAHIYYTRVFGEKHTMELTGVYSQSEQKWDGFSASRRDYVSSAVDQLFAGSSQGKDNSGNASKLGRIGYVGRVKYDYDNKYVLEGNFRYDGNDNFPDGNRFGFFPSISAGWNLDNEQFMEPFLESVSMSALKIRASWGVLGSTEGVGRFAYIPVYNLEENRYYINDSFVTGFSEGGLVSNNLTWFENESKNLGIDFGFLRGKVSGSFDWFYNRTTGFISNPSAFYSTPLGKPLPQVNTDSAFRRGGVEFSLNYNTNIGEAKILVGGNISYFDQLWEKRYDEEESALKNPHSRLTGQTDYYTRGFLDLGYYQTTDDILNSPRRLGSMETKLGDIKYQDLNGDGRIDGDDFQRIGKSDFPHISYGLNLGVEYKGFSLNTLFQGTGNRQIYLGNIWQNELNHKVYEIQTDYWTPDNRDALFPRQSTINNVNGGNNNVTSSFWLKDAWYLRMKSLSLSYDLKHSLLKDSSLSRFSLLVSATNLFTISPLNKYYLDPETSSSNNYGYPLQKALNIGFRIGF